MKMQIGIPLKGYQHLGALIFSSWKQKISAILSISNPTFKYIYDLGGNWHHTVKLEKVLPIEEGVSYPDVSAASGTALLKIVEALLVMKICLDPKERFKRAFAGE